MAMLLTVTIARRAGMNGWEEAGAVWAEASPTPPPTARLPTAATKDLRLIVRDRSQLLALVGMPVIFIGIQIFGAAGWSWTTGSLERISSLAYSLALYMGTIGPLTHMQAERRAFWILRTVPVPLGQLLAAKGRAWAIIVGAIAALAFAVLSVSVPHASIAERLAAGMLVTVGAAGMAFIAVAMASGGADLSDDTRTAVGPSTIYAYMFVGGLFNLVLVEDFPTRVAGLTLYAVAGWAYWQAGIEQAGFCLDAEVVRTRRLRAADGATMVILYALGGHAILKVGEKAGRIGLLAAFALQGVLLLLIAIVATIYLARRPRARALMRPAASLVVAAVAGAGGAGVMLATIGPHQLLAVPVAAVLALSILGQEVVFRGVLQRSIQEQLARVSTPGARGARARLIAAVVCGLVGVMAMQMVAPSPSRRPPIATIVAEQAFAAAAYALTGRVGASWLARAIVVGVAAFV
jgi:hypothetical protein